MAGGPRGRRGSVAGRDVAFSAAGEGSRSLSGRPGPLETPADAQAAPERARDAIMRRGWPRASRQGRWRPPGTAGVPRGPAGSAAGREAAGRRSFLSRLSGNSAADCPARIAQGRFRADCVPVRLRFTPQACRIRDRSSETCRACRRPMPSPERRGRSRRDPSRSCIRPRRAIPRRSRSVSRLSGV